MATIESWVLDGLALTSGAFGLMELTADPPTQRQDWIASADSEASALFRQPLHENRTITMKLRVTAQASMDTALDQVAALVDKLRAASASPAGIGLVWTPTDSARSRTFTVLAGEITGMPIALTGDGYSWVLHRPVLNMSLTCQPYWVGSETLTGTASSSTPFVTLEVPSVTGDIPALGRLIVTDTATQSRRHVEWGLEGPATYNASTSLIIDSDSLVTSGFAGTQTTQTGAYDPNATGSSVILAALLTGSVAVCGTGNQSHIGVFRVKARVWSDGGSTTSARLSWRAGDAPLSSNPWVSPVGAARWEEIDLGTITVPAAIVGSQRWTGQIEASDTSGTNFIVDYLVLVPASDGYGRARAAYTYTPGVITGHDEFTGTTSGSALGTRTAPAGGSWATSGDTTDYAFADNLLPADGIEAIQRSTAASESTGRYAILGTTTYTDVETSVLIGLSAYGGVSPTWQSYLIARYVDASNYLRMTVFRSGTNYVARLEQIVAGTVTLLATDYWQFNTSFMLRLVAYASGRAIGQVLTSSGNLLLQLTGSSTVLATSGTLAGGKVGIRDINTTANAITRAYTRFTVSTPAAEPIVVYSGKNMQVRYDDTLRQDSAGTYSGRPQSYRGSRFLVPVGTSRVLVKARRNDIELNADDQVTDATQIQVGWTPRGLAVPR